MGRGLIEEGGASILGSEPFFRQAGTRKILTALARNRPRFNKNSKKLPFSLLNVLQTIFLLSKVIQLSSKGANTVKTTLRTSAYHTSGEPKPYLDERAPISGRGLFVGGGGGVFEEIQYSSLNGSVWLSGEFYFRSQPQKGAL